VRRWVAGELFVSIQASRLIEELVRSKHGEQMRRLRAGYLNMIAGLTDSGIRGRLLAMDLAELRVDDQIRRAGFSEQLSASKIPPRAVPRPKIAGSRGDFGGPDGKMARSATRGRAA
jgi:hypothetical protein